MRIHRIIRIAAALLTCVLLPRGTVSAAEYGGGYAAAGQIAGVGYTTEIYDAANGLPTSDAMFLLSGSDGKMWIGGYSGVICYDGTVFDRLDTAGGLTSARGIFEDSRGRVWVATNDNGVVVLDGQSRTHLTEFDGLPSSSVRIFAEDTDGNVFIGTTAGVCYADTRMHLHEIAGADLAEERILRLDTGTDGVVYGQTAGGIVFSIEDAAVTALWHSDDLGTGKITTLLADPESAGKVWLGTEDGILYHGAFGVRASQMECISAAALAGSVHWLSYDCGRIWASSANAAGYLDHQHRFHLLDDLPVSSGIEMTCADYQGNLWFASSTQGVMKLVTNNFVDVSKRAGLQDGVANAACLYQEQLYIGTDSGVRLIGADGNAAEDALTRLTDGARIRCFAEDAAGSLWTAAYTNDLGLLQYTADGEIRSYTTADGMPDDQVRCVTAASDGSILAGTNGGLAVLREGKVVRTVTAADGIANTVFLTVTEASDGSILAGTDGGGLYVIGADAVTRLARADGLTSEVILRIVRDDVRGVCWLVTSNSIEYLRDGKITQVTSFPYNNNYDMYFDSSGHAWILSSYGIYCVNADALLRDAISDYRLYTVANGLPYAITSNSYSALSPDGDLYIPGRNGVIRLSIEHYFEAPQQYRTNVRAVLCGEKQIYPDADGVYQLPASRGRIQIAASVMDYTLLNPMVHVYLEGSRDDGITVPRSALTPLEYTNLPHGDYTLHIQIVDRSSGSVLQDDSYRFSKASRLTELLLFRILVGAAIALLIVLTVWGIIRQTVLAKQYDAVRLAKEEAERANTAKSRFLANISHEILTPINTIMGMNEMAMREDAAGVPQGYYMSMMNYAFDIRAASESLLSLINDLLDISKIESGNMHLTEQEYETQELLRTIISMNRVRCTEKALTFDTEIDEMLPRRMYGDAGKIRQIVLNFLTNAVKYTDVGGITLRVSMEERSGDTAKLRFSVKDTGRGIKEEDISRLFTAYERMDETLSSRMQGTGLGLDISRRFADLMGGTLHCESVYRQGSEFILTLPQRIVDAQPLGVFAEQDSDPAKGPYIPQFIAPDANILAIDSDPASLLMIKGLLKATRVFVTTSKSAEDALGKIRDTHFCAVLLDSMVPGADGQPLIDRIRAAAPELPVYAVTANASEDEAYYRAHGFSGYLPKPLDGIALEKLIMQHIPPEMMEQPEHDSAADCQTELPPEMQWLHSVPGLSVPDGIQHSGGVSSFLFGLRLFCGTVGDYADIIREAYRTGDLKRFTVKVHAVRTSAYLIGAAQLCDRAAALERSGKHQDMAYLRANTEQFLAEYTAFQEKLAPLTAHEPEDS